MITFESLLAQDYLTGQVISASSNEPLSHVSIFYDGTTLGTTTNEAGFFEIRWVKGLSSPLIISFIGFESIEIDEIESSDLGVLKLKPKTVELNEVVLEEDIWSREKKLAIFLEEFLGTTKAGLESTIMNPEALILRFSSAEKTLYAFSDKPLLITNPYLGYSISCVLENYETKFVDIDEKRPDVEVTIFSTRTLFSENKGKKIDKRRRKAYEGSVLHFMRSLASKDLEKQGFRVFSGGFQIDPYSRLKLKSLKLYTEVTVLKKILYIQFENRKNSLMKSESSIFFIDDYGNHRPTKSVLFGGEMGTYRLANLLPLDYRPVD